MSARSRKLLHENTLCIWLQAPAEELLARISGESTETATSAQGGHNPETAPSTPAGNNQETATSAQALVRPLADENFATRLESRLPLYEEASHISIDTSGLSPQDVADEIIISCL